MTKRALSSFFAIVILTNLPALSFAQGLRPDLMYCGSSLAMGADLYLGVGPFNEVSGCSPDADTQALLVTRNAIIAGNGAAWLSYLDAGGVIITEYSISANVYNELYATAYQRPQSRFGACTDNVMPSLKINPGIDLWQLNSGLTETPAGSEGCGYDLSTIVNGEVSVTALGGLAGTSDVSIAVRTQGAGVLWLVEADWQDGQTSFSDDSRNLMGVFISGGSYNFGAYEAVPVPAVTTLGMLLLILGVAYYSRRRIHA